MSVTKALEMDQSRLDSFSQRMLETLNASGLALMISVGHKTRLFDTLAALPPATSAAIAERAGLRERYVREWLGAMVTGRVVEYDPAAKTYWLPQEHATLLARGGSGYNFAGPMQFVPMLGAVEERVVRSFREGGGVPYEEFPHFHDLMAEESDQSVVAGLLDHVVPLVPGLRERLEAGIRVLDIGCGRGHAAMRLAEAFPRSTFIGYDLCEDAIAGALDEAARRGIPNVGFKRRDVSELHEKAGYDLVTAFDAIHDQAKPGRVLEVVRQSLREGGIFLMQDIRASSHLERNLDHPTATYLYTISCLHCMTVSLAQGGEGLGTVWGEELAVQMLREAGFANVEIHRIEHDIMNNWYIARPR